MVEVLGQVERGAAVSRVGGGTVGVALNQRAGDGQGGFAERDAAVQGRKAFWFLGTICVDVGACLEQNEGGGGVEVGTLGRGKTQAFRGRVGWCRRLRLRGQERSVQRGALLGIAGFEGGAPAG